tara:strand:+ start:577 stop:798 length:222 start_codon:yes stop_codon:yes gene_type:complete
MAFKMRGNPYKQMAGTKKEDITKELEEEIEKSTSTGVKRDKVLTDEQKKKMYFASGYGDHIWRKHQSLKPKKD